MHSHNGSGSTPALTPRVRPFGDSLAHAVAYHVVHQLGDRTGAYLAGVEDLVAEGVQQRLHPVENLPLAADHYRQVAGLRSSLASADRGV